MKAVESLAGRERSGQMTKLFYAGPPLPDSAGAEART